MIDVDELARALRSLHAQLLDCGRADYVRAHPEAGPIGTGEMLMLATQGEEFAWLRTLSELMAQIDELRDDPRAGADASLQGAVRAAVEELLGSHAEAATPFQVRYWQSIHDQPQVAMAHARVRQALQALPDAQPAGRQAMASFLAAKPGPSRTRP